MAPLDGCWRSSGPPTRLRYLVGSAIGSLSRLRRSPAAEDLVAAHAPRVSVLAQPEDDLPGASWESAPAGRMNETAAEFTPVIATPPSEPDLPEPMHLPTEPDRLEMTKEAGTESTPVNEPASFEPDILAAAHLCTELGRVEHSRDVQPLLPEAARILDAIGLIVWVWDSQVEELTPALSSGYSDKVLAQLPIIGRDADNATAAAFRSAQTCAINGGDHDSGALAVPLQTSRAFDQ